MDMLQQQSQWKNFLQKYFGYYFSQLINILGTSVVQDN